MSALRGLFECVVKDIFVFSVASWFSVLWVKNWPGVLEKSYAQLVVKDILEMSKSHPRLIV